MTDSKLASTYREFRAKGWLARWALSAARTQIAWDAASGYLYHGYDQDPENPTVRLRLEPDECCSYEDLAGDSFDPLVNSDICASQLEREEQAFKDRINRDGVWGLIGEFWDGSDWERADSCWGFVGDDWEDSGYMEDIQSATLDAWQAHKSAVNAAFAQSLEASRPDMYAA